MQSRKLKRVSWLFCSLVLTLSTTAFADTVYSNKAAFLNALGTHITDDYTNTGYHHSLTGFNTFTDAAMSAVLGQTQYEALTFPALTSTFNFVFQQNGVWMYCAGCNGSFSLNFGATSVSNGLGGVYGVGITIKYSRKAYAQITFTDGASILLPMPDSEFQDEGLFITDNRGISEIRFVTADGTNSNGGDAFLTAIRELTIGSQTPETAPVPEPASMVLLGSGLLGTAGAVRRKLIAYRIRSELKPSAPFIAKQ